MMRLRRSASCRVTGQANRTPVLVSISVSSSAPMLRPGRWRYLRTAKVMLQFPTYARPGWGLLAMPARPSA